jgi:hypothetical protein
MPGFFDIDLIDVLFPDNDLGDSHAEASREGQIEASNENFVEAILHNGAETIRDGFPIRRTEEEEIRRRAYQHQQAVDQKNRSGS